MDGKIAEKKILSNFVLKITGINLLFFFNLVATFKIRIDFFKKLAIYNAKIKIIVGDEIYKAVESYDSFSEIKKL